MGTRTAFITGVNSGIGGALAQGFLAAGWKVVGTVRNVAVPLPYSIPEGSELLLVELDVSNDQSIADLPDALQKSGVHHLDVVVNNAGMVVHGPLELIDATKLRQQLEVNVVGVLQVTNCLIPFLKRKVADTGHAFLVNMSSVSGLFAFPYLGPYSASKFALEALSDAYRRELNNFGIHVVKIQAGAIRTPIWQKALQNLVSLEGTAYSALEPVIKRSIKGSEKNALDPEKLVSLVLRICNSKNPSPAYLLAGNAWFFRAIPFLPVSWLDQFLHRYFKRLVRNTRADL